MLGRADNASYIGLGYLSGAARHDHMASFANSEARDSRTTTSGSRRSALTISTSRSLSQQYSSRNPSARAFTSTQSSRPNSGRTISPAKRPPTAPDSGTRNARERDDDQPIISSARALASCVQYSDMETVVNSAGLSRFPLVGFSQGCAVSIAYAVRHPERVSHLILYGGFAAGRNENENETAEARERLLR